MFPQVFGQRHAADHCDEKSSTAYRRHQRPVTDWKLQTHGALLLQEDMLFIYIDVYFE